MRLLAITFGILILGEWVYGEDHRTVKGRYFSEFLKSDGARLIDSELAYSWKEKGLTPSSEATDHEFIRRATLDILGRIPTKNEIDFFLSIPQEQRRGSLCEKLVHRGEFSSYFSSLLADRIMEAPAPRPKENYFRDQIKDWLEMALVDDMGWDEITQSLLTSKSSRTAHSKDQSLKFFLKSATGEELSGKRFGRNSYVPLSIRVPRVFLGVRIECAQCHNHPTDTRFSQKVFWDFNAFFRQTDDWGVDPPDLNPTGHIYYEDRKGISHPASPQFLDGQRPNTGENRREALARFILQNENFSKAFVNWMWAQMFGLSLNTPFEADDLSENSLDLIPSLSEKLSDHFRNAGYRPRDLVKWLCQSKAYGLTSRKGDISTSDEDRIFSSMKLKPLNIYQRTNSIAIALDMDLRTRNQLSTELYIDSDTESPLGAQLKEPIKQTLAMLNSPLLHQAIQSFVTRSTPKGANFFSTIHNYYLRTLGRAPLPSEMAVLRKMETTPENLEDLLLSLINSAYFGINY